MKKMASNGKTCIVLLALAGYLCGVRAQGLPGEDVISQGWRELHSKYSPLSNPAFLTEENYIALRGALASMLQGSFTLLELGGTLPIGLYQSAGLTLISDGSGSFPEIHDGNPTNKNVSFRNNFFTGTWAINPWNGLSAGLNVNVLHQQAFDQTRIGYGADIGLSYRLLKHQLLGNHLIGAFGQNLLPPSTTTFSGSKELFSRNLRLTWNGTYWEKTIENNFDFCIKDFIVAGSEFNPDSSKKFNWEFSGRIGGSILKMIRLYGLFSLRPNSNGTTELDRWGLAMGIDYPGGTGRDLGGAFQYTSPPKNENFFSGTFYARAEVGPHREEVYARKMAMASDVAPNQLYLRAVKLYSEGEYWNAFFLFQQILNEYPDFFKNDWVTYFAGSCQEHLDMRENSLLSYETVKLDNPQSFAAFPADLGIMRVQYRNEDYGAVAKQYDVLTASSAPDSLKYAASFIMGEAKLNQKDYQGAIELLSVVPLDHADYLFAQHSAAVAYLSIDKPLDAIQCLQNCINGIAETNAQKEIVNRSHLFLAYLLYENLISEEQPLSKAVTQLRKIPEKSIYHEEALLLAGWTAIKARQTGDIIASGLALQGAKSPALYFEGCLITAYGYVMQNNYVEAKNILEPAVDKIATFRTPSEDSLAAEKQLYIGMRTQYDFFAKKVIECAQKQQVGAVLRENSSLHSQQQEMRGKIDASLDFFDQYKRNTFLTRNINDIKQDLDYLLAHVSKRAVTKELQKEMDKSIKKQKSTDEEIEKLKEELKKMEEKNK